MTDQDIANMMMLITMYAAERIESEDPQLCMAIHGLMETISRIEGVSATKH